MDSEGRIQPDTEFRKSVDGFGGLLVVTTDSDWQEKWDTPPEVTPNFNTTSTVKIGETVTTLIFLVNPRTNADGEAHVRCSIRVTRPDGTASVNEADQECFRGPLEPEHRHNVLLAIPFLKFVGEPTDPVGEWVTNVKLIDVHRDTSIELTSRVTLVSGDS